MLLLEIIHKKLNRSRCFRISNTMEMNLGFTKANMITACHVPYIIVVSFVLIFLGFRNWTWMLKHLIKKKLKLSLDLVVYIYSREFPMSPDRHPTAIGPCPSFGYVFSVSMFYWLTSEKNLI